MTVKLTKEQAEKVKFFVKQFEEQMGDLTYDEFHSAICNGYEVESGFKVGDWIIGYSIKHDRKIIATVKDTNGQGIIASITDEGSFALRSKDCRHATESEIQQEKERRFWAVLGREVNEFKNRDIVKNPSGNTIELKGFIGFDNINVNELRLICPKENRLDVIHDDE